MATRNDKCEVIYQANIDVAAIKIWLRLVEPRPLTSAAVALVRSRYPQVPAREVVQWIIARAAESLRRAGEPGGEGTEVVASSGGSWTVKSMSSMRMRMASQSRNRP